MKLQQFLEDHLTDMQMCFGLTHFDVMIKRRAKMTDRFVIEVDYKYMDAKIIYGPAVEKAWRAKKIKYILTGLAHELTHIITGELDTKHRGKILTFYDERVTETVGRLLYRLYEKEYLE